MKKKRFTLLRLLAVALATAAGTFAFSATVLAATPAKWIDKTTIEYNGTKYIDKTPLNDKHQFHENGKDDPNICVDVIKEFNNADITKATKANLVKWQGPGDLIGSIPSPGLGRGATCVVKSSTPIDIDQTTIGEANKDPAGAPGSSQKNSCEAKSGVLGWLMCPVLNILDGVFNWLDTQIQALLEINEDSYTNPLLYQAWSNIRNIAFIILIPVMLVMVVGTALGSEMFSAYTVKKALPRMVAAILFMTLSWYICIFMIGFFNVIGSGMIGLITNPFGLKGTITLADLFSPSFGGFVIQGGGLAVGILATAFIAELAPILLLYFGGAVLVFFLAFLILTIRQMMILGLILAAPLAILAWIFPGNDKMWKVWWGTFSKLLIMYPLITSLIAMGRVFAYLVGHSPSGGLQGGLINPLLKITAYIMPYVLIPLTFKFAGGAFATLTGAVNDRSRGLFDRMKKGRHERMEKIAHNAKSGNLLRYTKGDGKDLASRLNRKVQTGTLLGAAGFSVKTEERNARIEAARERREFAEMKENIEKLDEFQPVRKDDDKLWATYHGTDRNSVRAALIDRAPSRFNEEEKKGDLDRAVEEVMGFKKKVGHEQSRLMSVMANAGTGTGFNYRTDADGNYVGDDDMNMALLQATGNNASMRGRMLAEMRPMLVQSGRQDIGGGGYAFNMQVLDKLAESWDPSTGDFKEVIRNEIDPTTGKVIYETNTDGSFKINAKGEKIAKKIKARYDVYTARQDIMQDVLRSNAGGAIAGKVKGVEQLAPLIAANAEGAMTAKGAGSLDEAIVELATVGGRLDAASQIAPQNARELRRSAMSHEVNVGDLNPELRKLLDPVITTYETRVEDVIDPATNQPVFEEVNGQRRKKTETKVHAVSSKSKITISEAMEQLRDHPTFLTMRREFRNAAVAQANAQMSAAAAQQGLPQAMPPINQF